MVNLKKIDFREFKKDVYRHYKEAFPRVERPPKSSLKKLSEKDIIKFVKILDENTDIGFLIYASIEGNPYIWLDYFAIYKEFQNKKYGSRAAQMFKDYFANYDGVYGEFEKEGFGVNEKENAIRHKRSNFWKDAGFELLDIDWNLYGVIYSSCVLRLKNKDCDNRKIADYGLELYNAVMGEKEVKKNCHMLTKE